MMILLSIFFIAVSCVIIWRASNGFEAASEYLGRNLTDGVRGATINAIGSSMPELITTLFFLFVLKDKDGFAGGIGTTAGSAIFNGMIIPAVVILVVVLRGVTRHVEVSKKVLLRDGISLLICEIVLIFLLGGETLNWIHGLVLMLLYAAYSIYLLTSMKKNSADETEAEEDDDDEDEDSGEEHSSSTLMQVITLDLEPLVIKKDITSRSAWTLLAVAIGVISLACFLLTKSCEWLGDGLNIPIYFVAVILASAATSVPDTILSMKDARKGNYDDAVSNALGSNIFDVCFALGFPLFLFTIIYGPITMSPETVENVSELRILLLLLTLIAFFIYIGRKKMGLMSAFLLLLIYAVFTLFILGKSVDSSATNEISSWLNSINAFIDNLRFWK